MECVCAICRDAVGDGLDDLVQSLRCGHVFHDACLTAYSAAKDLPLPILPCPRCKLTSAEVAALEDAAAAAPAAAATAAAASGIVEAVDDSNNDITDGEMSDAVVVPAMPKAHGRPRGKPRPRPVHSRRSLGKLKPRPVHYRR